MWRPLEDHCRHCYPWEKLKSKQSEPTGFASSFCPLWADSKWDLCKRSPFGSMALPARAREMGIRVSAGSKAGGGREAVPLAKRAGSFPTSSTLLHPFPASHVEAVGKDCPHLQRAAGVPGSRFTLLLYLLWIHPGKAKSVEDSNYNTYCPRAGEVCGSGCSETWHDKWKKQGTGFSMSVCPV